MNRLLAKVMTCWIPDGSCRRNARRRLMTELSSCPAELHGEGNEIIRCPQSLKVRICGNNNRVVFEETDARFAGMLTIGTPDCPVTGCTLTVGAGTTCEHITAWMLESGSAVSIGRDCMISGGVQIWCSDTHTLLDLDGHLLNGGSHTVQIGDHCWIGGGAILLKNVKIPNDCVVGLGAVVAGRRFTQEHVAIAGNPARVVREGLSWNRARPNQFRGDG